MPRIREDLAIEVLKSLRHGATQDELSEAIFEAKEAAGDTGKQASVTLKITFKPNGTNGVYNVKDEIKTTIPQLDHGDTLLYGTPEGLSQRDPRQQEMDLRTVETDEPPLKGVAAHV